MLDNPYILGVIVILASVAWILLILWLVLYGSFEFGPICFIVAFIVFVIPVGIVVGYQWDSDAKRPCVEYETRMHYNPSIKAVMPIRVCVLRGEWIEGEGL